MDFIGLQGLVSLQIKSAVASRYSDIIKQKINAAVRLISRSGYYPDDYAEYTYTAPDVDATLYSQALELPERTRLVDYVIDQDNPTEVSFSATSPGSIAQSYNGAKNCYYRSNSRLIILQQKLTTTFGVGLYSYPATLVNDSDTNWIVDSCEDLIVDLTTAWVLLLIGEREISTKIQQFLNPVLGLTTADLKNTLAQTVQSGRQ